MRKLTMKNLAVLLVIIAGFAGLGLWMTPVGVSSKTEVAEQIVNVYSSRKEELVRELFDSFTEETGIKVNFIRDKAPKLIARLQSEGELTPADVFLTTDVGNLDYAKELGLLQPHVYTSLRGMPKQYYEPEGYWYGLSLRARVIVYSRDRVKPEELSTYEDLSDAKWKGRVLVRSSSNIYNQSLIASLIEVHGIEDTEAWGRGLVANFARTPQGGDTDQIRAVAAGEGDVAIVNSYYYGRLMASDKPEDQAVVKKVGIFFPNQENRGTHVNISGGGVVKYAKNKSNALALLEFLASSKAQKIYAQKNHEYPILPDVPMSEVVGAWGEFKKDNLPLAAISKHRQEVLKIADRVGWR